MNRKRVALLILLLFMTMVYADEAKIPLYEFCQQHELKMNVNLDLNYVKLTHSTNTVKIFPGLPYLSSGESVYYMSTELGISDEGELQLTDEYTNKIVCLLFGETEEETVTVIKAVTNEAVTVTTNSFVGTNGYSETFISLNTPDEETNINNETDNDTSEESLSGTIIDEPDNIQVIESENNSEKTASNDEESYETSYNDSSEDYLLIDTIIIDAGHGGTDPGGMRWDGVKEKDIVLSIAENLSEMLEADGDLNVVMSRDTDVFVTLEDRTGLSAEVAADSNPLFISIHANISLDSRVEGIEVYSLSDSSSDDDAQSVMMTENQYFTAADIEATSDLYAIIADLIRDGVQLESDELSECVYDSLIDETGANERGTKKAGFYVLKYNPVPSILIEVGFLSHDEESELLLDSGYQSDLASGIYNGIQDFVELYNKTRGFSE